MTDNEIHNSSSVYERWKSAVDAGFQPVPNVLVLDQKELNLTDREIIVFLNINAHWYYEKNKSFVSAQAIANRMGTKVRNVQRALQSLTKKGFVKKIKEGDKKVFDISCSIEKLAPFAQKRKSLFANKIENPSVL